MTQLDRLEQLAEKAVQDEGDPWPAPIGAGDDYGQFVGVLSSRYKLREMLTPQLTLDLIRVARAAKELVDLFGRLPGEPDRIDKLADALLPLFSEVES